MEKQQIQMVVYGIHGDAFLPFYKCKTVTEG